MTNEWESRVRQWLSVLQKNLYRPVEELTFRCFYTEEQLNPKEAAEHTFVPIEEGEVWGKEWEYGWFMASVTLGEWARGKRVVMDLNLGGEATLYVDGKPFGTRRDDWIVQQHHLICDNYLTKQAQGTETFQLLAECYAGHEKPAENGECTTGPYFLGKEWERPDGNKLRKTIGKNTVGIWREDAYHLYLEASILYEIWQNEPEESLRRWELEKALKIFCLELDFEVDEEAYLAGVRRTRKLLEPYLACRNGSTAPVFHAIGHAHIDLAWLWPVEETKRKCARTMAAQIRHMEEYPDYKMIISQPWLMEQIEVRYPELFREMTGKIEGGQLIPEGGMWVEADTNIPSGESLIRQFLYGKRYLKEKFGVESTLLWLPDVFGYSGSLPQIMKGCGITHFTTHKIFWTYNGGEPFPYHYFNWKGIDGTRIPTFIHVEYSSSTNAATLIQRWKNREQKMGIKRLLQPFGYGDGGGGASRDHIENCLLAADLEGVPRVVFDDPRHFFSCLEADGGTSQEYVGELYYQAHRGTYTSQAKTKLGNRQGEMTLREAELWNAAAWSLFRKEYPVTSLEKAWKLLLFQQFHDILPGSSIHRVYERAEKELAETQKISGQLLEEALHAFCGYYASEDRDNSVHKTDTLQELTYFNSLSWKRTAVVDLPEDFAGAVDEQGNPLFVQQNGHRLIARIELPSCGMAGIRKAEENYDGAALEHAVTAVMGTDRNTGKETVYLDNGRLALTIDCCGRIESILDQEDNKRQWAEGFCNELRMYQDIPGHYEAWDLDSIYREKRVEIAAQGQIYLEEKGPLRAVVRVERSIGKSPLTQWITMEADSRVVSIRTRIDWCESHKLLKAAFPVRTASQELCSEIQYGWINRPTHSSRSFDRDRFEVCNHRWSALMETNCGFAVLNDCKYGISCEGNCMELSLLKSSGFPDETADKGMQEFVYGFTLWNTSFDQSDLIRRAYEMNCPVSNCPGICSSVSLVQVGCPNIILDTLKRGEDGKCLVLRLYESKGGHENTSVTAVFPFQRAFVADMLERPEQEIVCGKGTINLSFRPFEIKTVLLGN